VSPFVDTCVWLLALRHALLKADQVFTLAPSTLNSGCGASGDGLLMELPTGLTSMAGSVNAGLWIGMNNGVVGTFGH